MSPTPKRPTIYLATSLVLAKTASYWMRRLEHIGFEITHDWTQPSSNPSGRGELELDLLEQSGLAKEDYRGVCEAGYVWVQAPEAGGCGCWFEMGCAHAKGKKLIVSGPRRTIFTTLADHYSEAHEGAFEWLSQQAGRK